MYTSNKLFFYIFVVTLYGGEKCVCSVLENDRGLAETYIQLKDTNPDYSINTENSASNTPSKRLKFYDADKSNVAEKTKTEVVKRVTRQAQYEAKSLYPRLPTAPYQQQSYQNQNYNFNSQTNYTNPAYQQWHHSQPYNNSRPGYPAYNPSYNNSYPTPPYNSFQHRPTYNPHGSYNNYNPNDKYQQHNNPTPDPGYPHRNPVLPSGPNLNPYSPPGYPQPYNYSGYPPHSSNSRNNSYNPMQTPTYYPSGNFPNSHASNYSVVNNKYPNSFYSTSLPPSLNHTVYGSAQTNFPSNWTLTGRVTNTSHSYYPGGQSHNPYQNNGSFPYGVNEHGVSVPNFNGTHQSYYPKPNNLNSNFPQNYPARGPGSTAYNNTNNFNPNQGIQGMYPKPNQYGTNYYPHNQFNGTSTYRLAENYTPSIPSQPPRNGTPQQHQFYYPTNMNGTHPDPTKVSPERFSYH